MSLFFGWRKDKEKRQSELPVSSIHNEQLEMHNEQLEFRYKHWSSFK